MFLWSTGENYSRIINKYSSLLNKYSETVTIILLFHILLSVYMQSEHHRHEDYYVHFCDVQNHLFWHLLKSAGWESFKVHWENLLSFLFQFTDVWHYCFLLVVDIFSGEPYLQYVFGQTGLSNQCRSRWDAAECGISSGSTLFDTHPQISKF